MAVNTLLITTASHLKYFKIPLRNVFFGGAFNKNMAFFFSNPASQHMSAPGMIPSLESRCL